MVLPVPAISDPDTPLSSRASTTRCLPIDVRAACACPVGTANFAETEPVGAMVLEIRVRAVQLARWATGPPGLLVVRGAVADSGLGQDVLGVSGAVAEFAAQFLDEGADSLDVV